MFQNSPGIWNPTDRLLTHAACAMTIQIAAVHMVPHVEVSMQIHKLHASWHRTTNYRDFLA